MQTGSTKLSHEEQARFFSAFKEAVHSDKNPEEKKTTPLHLVARLLPLQQTKAFRGVLGDLDPTNWPPPYEETLKTSLGRYAHIQDEEGNTPIHYTLTNQNWELSRFLASYGVPAIRNNAGITPQWLIAKSIPFQFNRSHEESDCCYQMGCFMTGGKKEYWGTDVDANRWSVLHWMAFKGYTNPWYAENWLVLEYWKSHQDLKGLKPRDIENLIQSLVHGKTHETTEKLSTTFSKLPKDRQIELTIAIQERNRHAATKIHNLSNILNPKD
ncbi:MAG: hypothetical protein ACK5MA_01820 [Parachlamydiaceae bacterium]